jgi:hypothetical protein
MGGRQDTVAECHPPGRHVAARVADRELGQQQAESLSSGEMLAAY